MAFKSVSTLRKSLASLTLSCQGSSIEPIYPMTSMRCNLILQAGDCRMLRLQRAVVILTVSHSMSNARALTWQAD